MMDRRHGVEKGDWLRATTDIKPARERFRLGACPPFPRSLGAARKRGQRPKKGTGTVGNVNHHCPINRRRSQSPFSGFTLIEVLLALALSAIMLAAMWGLFHVYGRLFETGQVKTEQAQLARTLLEQLTDDLHAAIEDSPSRDPSSGSAGPVRRFGLLGTSDSLRIDILEVIPPEESPDPDADVGDARRDRPLRQVPELRTVVYSFEDPAAWRLADEEPTQWSLEGPTLLDAPMSKQRPGLTRRELDFETPAGKFSGERQVSVMVDTDNTDRADLDDPSLTWVPEVVGVQFRYFDGIAWAGQWNSLERRSLPVAVEVTLKMRSAMPRKPQPRAEETDLATALEDANNLDIEDESDLGLSEKSLRLRPPGPPPREFRLVIDMPSAKQHGEVRRQEPLEVTRPAAPPSLAAPRPIGPRPIGVPTTGIPSTANRSDQWMRTEQP